MHQNILIVGHSHVECLRPAAATGTEGDPAITIVDIQLHRKESLETRLDLIRKAPPSPPDAVCLCMIGNTHNAFGILEHPKPFSVGDAEAGALPRDERRWFIPYQLMLDEFRHQYRAVRSLSKLIFAAFPEARRLVLNAPPPISDWKHIRNHPGVFAKRLAQGPGPDDLRRKLFQVQSVVVREIAEDLGAIFVDPAPLASTPMGFLDKPYYSTDPTHGNAAYGKIALARILATLRKDV